MTVFEDRADAGRRLAETLAHTPVVTDAERLVVLAIPRGGLPVGLEVSRALGAALDVLVVRKLRDPLSEGRGYGSVGPDGHVELDDGLVKRLGLSQQTVEKEVADRRDAVDERLEMYRTVVHAADLSGAVVVVVDDGIATGSTARQALALARRSGATRVVLAVPVAPADVIDGLSALADAVVVLSTPDEFLSVGQAYRDFDHLDDATVMDLLRSAQAA